jgi:hypothetical protein
MNRSTLRWVLLVVLLPLVLLLASCQQRCDCGWLTGPVYCDEDGTSGMTWAYLPDWSSVDEWMVNIIGEIVECPSGMRQICGVENVTTVLREDGWVMLHADVMLCSPPPSAQ